MNNENPGTGSSLRQSVLIGILILVVAQSFVIGVGCRGVNCDLFYGLATGDNVLHGRLTEPDLFSFTRPGKVWVDQNWLSNFFYYISHRFLGSAGPVFIKTLLLAGCVALLFYRCLRLGASIPVSLFSVWLALLAAAPFMKIRGENFGVFYFLFFTALLSQADRGNRARRFGIPLLMLLWSNSHGSFMLGLGLLGVKTGLVFLRRLLGAAEPWSDDASWRRTGEWIGISLVSLLIAAFCNPYGTQNILMPFNQIGATFVTAVSADWLPIISRGHVYWWVGPGSVVAYVAFLLFLLLSAVALLLFGEIACRKSAPPIISMILSSRSAGRPTVENERTTRRSGIRELASWLNGFKTDWLMECVTVLIAAAMAFKFRRLILFSGLSLAPIAAVLLTALTARSRQMWATSDSWRIWTARFRFAPIAASILIAAGGTWLLYRLVILPYSPENPITPKRSAARKLMSYDTFSPELAAFLSRNGLRKRVLAGWQVASYLMWRVPDVTLFMDTRDQQRYPAKVLSDFFSIMGMRGASSADRFGLLRAYGVKTVVMTDDPYDFQVALWLLKSRRWGCVYKDDESTVLVRIDSPDYKEPFAKLDFSSLWYPNEALRIRSEAFHARFHLPATPPKLADQLKVLAKQRPGPDIYKLLSWGGLDKRGCLKPPTRDFLTEEVKRLSRMSPFYAHGAEEITLSLVAISEILLSQRLNCTSSLERTRFEILRRLSEKKYDTIFRQYVGPPI